MWLTAGTLAMAQDLDGVAVQVIDSHAAFAVDGLEIRPFPVPHDAREPVQYVFGDGDRRLGVLTDAGCSTPHIEAMLCGVDALVLECNHDAEMLESGPYPASLKRRVGGRFGHLENGQSAALLDKLKHEKLRCVMARTYQKEQHVRPGAARPGPGAGLCG